MQSGSSMGLDLHLCPLDLGLVMLQASLVSRHGTIGLLSLARLASTSGGFWEVLILHADVSA